MSEHIVSTGYDNLQVTLFSAALCKSQGKQTVVLVGWLWDGPEVLTVFSIPAFRVLSGEEGHTLTK